MRLEFLVDTPLDPRGFPTRASARYRALIPGRALAAAGDSVRFVTLDQALAGPPPAEPVDLLVLGKLFRADGGAYLDARLAQGARLVIDFCDDNFQRYDFHGAYGRFVSQAAALTVSTPVLAEKVAAALGRRPIQIDDPIEGPVGAPRFSPHPQLLRLVWFGASSSLDSLRGLAVGLAAWRARSAALAGRKLQLAVVTAINRLPDELAWILATLDQHCDLLIKLWSPQTVWTLLSAADMLVLPKGEGGFYQMKSANRLLEGLNAGRAVVAQPIPAYAPFTAGCFLDADIFAALDAALSDSAATVARIGVGQRLALTAAAPAVIAAQWRAALAPLMG